MCPQGKLHERTNCVQGSAHFCNSVQKKGQRRKGWRKGGARQKGSGEVEAADGNKLKWGERMTVQHWRPRAFSQALALERQCPVSFPSPDPGAAQTGAADAADTRRGHTNQTNHKIKQQAAPTTESIATQTNIHANRHKHADTNHKRRIISNTAWQAAQR